MIFLWALGQDWHHQVSDFLHQRDKLWARMGFRAVVRRQSCEEVRLPAPASQGWGKRLDLPPPTYHPLFSRRSWPRSRPTGPGLGSGTPTMAGLKGATQRPRFPSPGVLASRHPTVLSVPCPLTAASAATTPAPCLSYPSAFPTTLSGTALHPKLGPGVGASSLSCPPSCYWSQAPTPSTVSRDRSWRGAGRSWEAGVEPNRMGRRGMAPGVQQAWASVQLCTPLLCELGRLPLSSSLSFLPQSSLSCCCALGADTRRVKNSLSACLLAQCSTDCGPSSLLSSWPQAGRAAHASCPFFPTCNLYPL